MKNKSAILVFSAFISVFLMAFSPFEKETEESVEGRKKYAVGEMAEAESEFSKAAKRLENNAEAYYDLGNALQSQQKYEDALTAYKKSLESGNASQKLRADIFHNMANSFAGLGKYQDAEKFYIRSLEEEPSKDTAENLEIVRRIIAQQKEQQEQQQQNQDQQKNEDQQNQDQEENEQQDKQDQNQEDQEKQEEEKKENQEQNENPDDEQNDESNEGNDDDRTSSENSDDGETQDEENGGASAEEQDDEQNDDDKTKESSVLKQFKQRKNLQISPFMLKKEQKSDNGQTW